MGFWLAVLFWTLGFGATSAFIADNKNRDGVGWFFLGAFFGVFALIAICAVSALEKKPDEDDPIDSKSKDERFDPAKPWLKA